MARAAPEDVQQATRTQPSSRQLLGENLRELRRSAGWSQSDLARESGVPRALIGAVERGQGALGLDRLDQLAAALQIRPWQLLRPDGAYIGRRWPED